MKKGKILWLDLETTGLDPRRNDIIELAAIVEIDTTCEEFHTFLRPIAWENIDQEALAVHGIPIEEVEAAPSAQEAHSSFTTFLSQYVNRYNRDDKFVIAGYNVGFDTDFLREFFKKCNDKYYGSYFFWPTRDVKNSVAEAILTGLRAPNYKLSTMCETCGIELKEAHNALYDIRATRALYLKLESWLAN
jgi:DNA polymerase-3 subunit epsilon